VIKGLTYISGNLTTTTNPTFNNLIVGGTLSCGGTLNATFDSSFANNPPPGFYTVQMQTQGGSWTQPAN
jgi:hypothetical protein